MELLFQEYELSSLDRAWTQTVTGEQTADVLIPDTYPDVDRIIDAFGTLFLQETQCMTDSVEASGTVRAGVLYVGEKGEVHSLKVTIPFSARKEWTDKIEGAIPCFRCELQSVDARTVNSRKLLVRVGFRCLFEIYTPINRTIRYLDAPTEQLQLRQAEYPTVVPVATGEKRFTINEELELPGTVPAVAELMKWSGSMQLLEQKVVGNKGVFKMEFRLHLLYEDPEGKLCVYDRRIPVSQFVDLTGDAEEGQLHTTFHMTEMELEPDSQIESRRLFLRVGIIAGCMAYETRSVKVIEDAFCTDGALEAQWQQWQSRPLLDTQILRETARRTVEETVSSVVDVWAWPEKGEREQKENGCVGKVPLVCSLLYFDGEGKLRGKQLRFSVETDLPMAENTDSSFREIVCAEAYCNLSPGAVEVRVPVQLTVDSFGQQGFRSLHEGQILPKAEEEHRPSLILRRTEEEEELWNIAKRYGTAVKAIREANDLGEDLVAEGTMLLIPL
ncbi:MAG: DUF3794 domain-containing protein [Oscillospiraceae bacterium]|nr:DUF3794 domain-containing protein [Oscillospiraceae bacterium]